MPATSFAFPQNFEQDVNAILPDLLFAKMRDEGSPLAKAFPFTYTSASFVKWDQYGDPYGLIPVRGMGASPMSVKLSSMKIYVAAPGFYGLVTTLNEEEMTFARQPNTVAEPLDIDDRLAVTIMYCTDMVYNRVRRTTAELAITGEFTNVNAGGQPTHSYKIDNYQTFSPANDGVTGPGWAADPINARPISDLIYWQTNQLNKGTSADFGKDSMIICNPSVVNDIWNTQQVQLAFKNKFGATYLRGEMPNLDGDQSLNALLLGMGLPPLVVDAGGFYETMTESEGQDPDDFTYFMSEKSLVWIGKRPANQQVAAFKLTRHVGLEAGGPQYDSYDVEGEGDAAQVLELQKGLYVNVHFNNRMPHAYEIEMGFNAAPVIYYRRAFAGITYT
jgi:hypothetical protein